MCKFRKFLMAVGVMLPMIWGHILASLIVTTLDQMSINYVDEDDMAVESLTTYTPSFSPSK